MQNFLTFLDQNSRGLFVLAISLTFDKQISEAKNERSSARFVDMG